MSSRHRRHTPTRARLWRSFAALCAVSGVMISATLAGSGSATTVLAAAKTHRAVATKAPAQTAFGTLFTSNADGSIGAISLYRSRANSSARTGALWSSSGDLLASVTMPARQRRGWQTVALPDPVSIGAGERYVVGYVTAGGRYTYVRHGLARPVRNGHITSLAGLQGRGDAMPTRGTRGRDFQVQPVLTAVGDAAPGHPSHGAPVVPPVPAATNFPNSANTGVPASVRTTPYTGPLTITTPTTIDSKVVTGTLVVKAPLTVRNSVVNGTIDADYDQPVDVTDSEVDGGTSQVPAVGYGDVSLLRVEVRGARVSVLCGTNCLIQDSWLHAQYLKPGSDWHVNGYLSNGGSGAVLSHNTIACDPVDNSNGGGCTGPAASFGDFAPLRNITYQSNLFQASPGGYCLAAGYNPGKPYGADPTGITVTNNVFERGASNRCAYYGPVTSFLQANGNSWSNNVWSDNRATLAPAR